MRLLTIAAVALACSWLGLVLVLAVMALFDCVAEAVGL